MEVVTVQKSVTELLEELKNDLSRNDIKSIARLPLIREYERYRDVILTLLREFHIALVLIRLSFENGELKNYAFLIKGEEGAYGEIPSKGIVEGHLIHVIRGIGRKFVYQPIRFNNSSEVASKVFEFAELYRKVEEKISRERLIEEALRDLAGYYSEAPA